MRLISKCLLTLILLTASWVATDQQSINAAETDSDRVYPTVYRVSDLPTWTGDRKFDVSILMRLVRLTTKASDWESNGGSSSYTCYPENLSLVVSTHRQNHQKIKELMKAIRKDIATK
ncbi:MAG: hypothetical protein AAGI63_18530 [Planctomycetota bacterium]